MGLERGTLTGCPFLLGQSQAHTVGMSDKTFLVQYKAPETSNQIVVAARFELHGEHLVFLNGEGKLTALFLMEIVESWSEIGS